MSVKEIYNKLDKPHMWLLYKLFCKKNNLVVGRLKSVEIWRCNFV